MKRRLTALGGSCGTILLLAVVLSSGSSAPLTGSPDDPRAGQGPVDLRPATAHREVARDVMRALAVSLENIASEGSESSATELAPVRAFMNRMPGAARENLLKATRRFSAGPDQALRTFYGPQYAPTPQARLQNLAAIVRSLQARRTLILRPVRPPGAPKGHAVATPSAPAPLFESVPGLPPNGPFAGTEPESAPTAAQKFSAPHEDHLELRLDSIRVNALNDDDTPDDEIYLGVWAVPGPRTLIRVPGSDYWRFTRGQTRTLDVGVRNFGSVTPGRTYTAFVSVFEEDDGTWGEIWSTFIQIAEFAFEQWLQAEIGMVAAEIVNYFLNDLWGWIAAWFENPDDFINSAVLAYDFVQEPKFWAPGPSGSPQVSHEKIAIASGADANYRLTFHWTLRRVSIAR